jgi:hypothetical protein
MIRGGPQAVSKKKSIAKRISDTEGIKETAIHVCHKSAFVG